MIVIIIIQLVAGPNDSDNGNDNGTIMQYH